MQFVVLVNFFFIATLFATTIQCTLYDDLDFARIQAQNNQDCSHYAKIIKSDGDKAVVEFHRAVYCNCIEATNGVQASVNCILKGCELSPNYADHFYDAGLLLMKLKSGNERALGYFKRALEIDPNHQATLVEIGILYIELNLNSLAIPYQKKAVKLDKLNYRAYNVWGRGAIKTFGKQLEAHNAFKKDTKYSLPAALLSSHYTKGLVIPRKNFLLHKNIGKEIESQNKPLINPNDKATLQYRSLSPLKLLRVGVVSEDLYHHSVAYFATAFATNYNRNEIELYCYYYNSYSDEITELFKKHCTVWRVSQKWDADEILAKTIFNDKVDILIDLMGHAGHSKPPVFAMKPAPVQVTWLGYPATTGLTRMDYRLTDQWADPVELETDQYHTETLIRLKQGFLVYQPPTFAPEDVGELPAIVNGHISFGVFNSISKITKDMIAVWARIMQQLPKSTILMKAGPYHDPTNRKAIKRVFKRYGINANRITTVTWTKSKQKHLEMYKTIDITMDTHPYNGAATSAESLYMGVPFVTWAGKTHVSRVGTSILTRMGLEDLIANSKEEYISKVVALASDVEKLRTIRSTMRERYHKSAFSDAVAQARELEDVFHDMWWNFLYDNNFLETDEDLENGEDIVN